MPPVDVRGAERSLAGAGDDLLAPVGDAEEPEAVGAVDHRHEEAVVDRDGDPDVHLVVDPNAPVDPGGIHARVIPEGRGRRADEQIGDAHAAPEPLPGDVSPARQPARVNLAEEVEVRRGRPAPRRPLGHDAPDPGGRQLLAGAELAPARRPRRSLAARMSAATSAPCGPTSGDEGVEVDAALGRQAAGLRRGQPAPRDPVPEPGSPRPRRGGRRRLDGGTGPPRSRSAAPPRRTRATTRPSRRRGRRRPGARTPARMPSAGASISTVTLSVSISIKRLALGDLRRPRP